MKKQITNHIAKKYRITDQRAAWILEDILEQIIEHIEATPMDDFCQLRHFGTWHKNYIPAQKITNMKEGGMQERPGYIRISFRPAQGLKARINKKELSS